jgi:hypothetical protein
MTFRVSNLPIPVAAWLRALVCGRFPALGLRVRIPVAARSKALVCGRFPAGTAGSNPGGRVA